MPWKVVRHKNKYKVKNLTTGKLSKNSFKEKKNAEIQVRNRYRFSRTMAKKAT